MRRDLEEVGAHRHDLEELVLIVTILRSWCTYDRREPLKICKEKCPGLAILSRSRLYDRRELLKIVGAASAGRSAAAADPAVSGGRRAFAR